MNQTRRVFNQNTLNELDHSIKTSKEMKFEEYDKLISESIIQNMFHTNQEAFQSHNYQLQGNRNYETSSKAFGCTMNNTFNQTSVLSNKLVSAQFNITSNKINSNINSKNCDYIENDRIHVKESTLFQNKDDQSIFQEESKYFDVLSDQQKEQIILEKALHQVLLSAQQIEKKRLSNSQIRKSQNYEEKSQFETLQFDKNGRPQLKQDSKNQTRNHHKTFRSYKSHNIIQNQLKQNINLQNSDYLNLSQEFQQNQAKLIEIPQNKKQLLKKFQDTHKKLVKYLQKVKNEPGFNGNKMETIFYKQQQLEIFKKQLENETSLESMIMRNDLNVLLNTNLKNKTQTSNIKSPNSHIKSYFNNSSQKKKEEMNQNSGDTSQYDYMIDHKLKPLLNKQVSDYFSQRKESLQIINSNASHFEKYQNRIPKIIRSQLKNNNDDETNFKMDQQEISVTNSVNLHYSNQNKTLVDQDNGNKENKSIIKVNSLSSNENEYTTSIIAKPIFNNQDYFQLIKPNQTKQFNEKQISILKSKIQTPAIQEYQRQNKIYYQQLGQQKQIKFEDLLQQEKQQPTNYNYQNNERIAEKRNSNENIKIVNQQKLTGQKNQQDKTFLLSGKHISDKNSMKQAEQPGYQKIKKRQKIKHESQEPIANFIDHGCNPKSEQSSPLLLKKYGINTQTSMNQDNIDHQNQKIDDLNSSLYIPQNMGTPLQLKMIRSQSKLNLKNDSSEMNSAIEIKQFSIRESQTFQNGQDQFKYTFYNVNQANKNESHKQNNLQSSQNFRRTIIDIGSINGNSDDQFKIVDKDNQILGIEAALHTESNHIQNNDGSFNSIHSLEQRDFQNQNASFSKIIMPETAILQKQQVENPVRKSQKRAQNIDKKRNTIPNQDLIDNVLQIQHVKKETIERSSGSPFKKFSSKDYVPVLKKSIIFQREKSQGKKEEFQGIDERIIEKKFRDAELSSTVINSGLDSSRNTLIPSLKLKQLPHIHQININRRQTISKLQQQDSKHQQHQLFQSGSQEKLRDQMLLDQLQGIENISNVQPQNPNQINQKRSILHVVDIQLLNQNNYKQKSNRAFFTKQQKNENQKSNSQKKQRNKNIINSELLTNLKVNNNDEILNSKNILDQLKLQDEYTCQNQIDIFNDQQALYQEKQKHSITINITEKNDENQQSNEIYDLLTNRNKIQTETQTQNQELLKTLKDKKIGNIILKNFQINKKYQSKMNHKFSDLQKDQIFKQQMKEKIQFANQHSASIDRVNSQLIQIYKSQTRDLSLNKGFLNNSLENLSFLAEISELNHTISQPRDFYARQEIVMNQSLRSRMSQKSRFTISDFNKNLTSKDSINKFKKDNLYHLQTEFQNQKKNALIIPQQNIRVKKDLEKKVNKQIKYDNMNRLFNSSLSNYNKNKPQKDNDLWKQQIQETNQKIEKFIQKINHIETYRQNQQNSQESKKDNQDKLYKNQNGILVSFQQLNERNSRSNILKTQGNTNLNQSKYKKFSEKIEEAKIEYELISQPKNSHLQQNKSTVKILSNKQVIKKQENKFGLNIKLQDEKSLSRQKMNSYRDDSSLKTQEHNDFEAIPLKDASHFVRSSKEEDYDQIQKYTPVSIRSIINQKEKIARNQMLSTFSGIGKRIQIQQVKMNDKVTHFTQKHSIKFQNNRNAANTATSDYEFFQKTYQNFTKEVERQKLKIQANMQQQGMKTTTSQMTGGSTVDDKNIETQMISKIQFSNTASREIIQEFTNGFNQDLQFQNKDIMIQQNYKTKKDQII